jgi:integrase
MLLLKHYKSFTEILSAFLNEKRIQIKHHSYQHYTGITKVFSAWLTEKGLIRKPLKWFTNEILCEFSIYLANVRKLDRSTCYKYRDGIRAVWKFAKKRGQVKEIPFDFFVFPPKRKDHSAALIPTEKIPALLRDILIHDFQLFLALMLEYYCGARPGKEVRLIRVRNFNLADGYVRIDSGDAKSAKTRLITMSEDLIKILIAYGIQDADPDMYLFGPKRKLGWKPVSENMFRYRFNKFRKAHGLSDDVKVYSFKHLGASVLIFSKLLDIEQLRQHLGHANITATQKYVHQLMGAMNMDLRTKFPNPMIPGQLAVG